jgi:hypothetical protein
VTLLASPHNPIHRTCRQCRKSKWWDPEARGGEWYTRRVKRDDHGRSVVVLIPSSYCRVCENAKRVTRRQTISAIAKLEETDPTAGAIARARYTRGPCACCRREMVGRSVDTQLCTECGEAVDTCVMLATVDRTAVQVAEAMWETISEHLVVDVRIDLEVAARRDRPRRDHEFAENPPAATHAQCLWLEQLWRKVWKYLAAQQIAAAVELIEA